MIWRLPGRPWFTVHRYGVGASPKTWEGWLFTALFFAGLMLIADASGLTMSPVSTYSYVAFTIGALVLIAVTVLFVWLKSDAPWRWRWDGREKDPDLPLLKRLPDFMRRRRDR